MNAEQAIAFLSKLPPDTPLLTWNIRSKQYEHTYLEHLEFSQHVYANVSRLCIPENSFVTMRAEKAF